MKYTQIETDSEGATVDIMLPGFDACIKITVNPGTRTLEINSRITKPGTSDQWDEQDFMHTDEVDTSIPEITGRMMRENLSNGWEFVSWLNGTEARLVELKAPGDTATSVYRIK